MGSSVGSSRGWGRLSVVGPAWSFFTSLCVCLIACVHEHVCMHVGGVGGGDVGCHALCFLFETVSPPWPEAHLLG